MVGIHIARATPADVKTVVLIERASFSDPWSESSFRDVLNHQRIYFACARLSDESGQGSAADVAGYVVAWFAGSEGEIANLAVDPSLRRQGIGAALLDAALSEGRRLGTSDTYLEVRSSNLRARQLYESRGFVEVGRRRNYYRRPVEDAVILRRTERVAAAQVEGDV